MFFKTLGGRKGRVAMEAVDHVKYVRVNFDLDTSGMFYNNVDVYRCEIFSFQGE